MHCFVTLVHSRVVHKCKLASFAPIILPCVYCDYNLPHKKRCRNQAITAERKGAKGQGEAAQRGQEAEGGRVRRVMHRSRRQESRGVDTERSHHIGVPAALLSSAPFE